MDLTKYINKEVDVLATKRNYFKKTKDGKPVGLLTYTGTCIEADENSMTVQFDARKQTHNCELLKEQIVCVHTSTPNEQSEAVSRNISKYWKDVKSGKRKRKKATRK